MVDVGEKPATAREAIAQASIRMAPETLALALAGNNKKGDVISVAEIAGIMGGKKTSDLIPLCHPIALTQLTVSAAPSADLPGFVVTARAKTTGQTGVEMEALMAVTIACLTIFDILKAADQNMAIEGARVLQKSGGASGDYRRGD